MLRLIEINGWTDCSFQFCLVLIWEEFRSNYSESKGRRIWGNEHVFEVIEFTFQPNHTLMIGKCLSLKKGQYIIDFWNRRKKKAVPIGTAFRRKIRLT